MSVILNIRIVSVKVGTTSLHVGLCHMLTALKLLGLLSFQLRLLLRLIVPLNTSHTPSATDRAIIVNGLMS